MVRFQRVKEAAPQEFVKLSAGHAPVDRPKATGLKQMRNRRYC